jgi:hypothetical protein
MSVTVRLETGQLDNLIRETQGPVIRRYVCDGVEYGYWQEVGVENGFGRGIRIPAHPFMRPAAEAVRDDFEYALKNALVFPSWSKLEDVVAETAFRLKFIAQDHAPVDTGALRASIDVQRDEPL